MTGKDFRTEVGELKWVSVDDDGQSKMPVT